jgi:hypothetical protein
MLKRPVDNGRIAASIIERDEVRTILQIGKWNEGRRLRGDHMNRRSVVLHSLLSRAGNARMQ